jgi:hypothetical protein
VVCDVNTTKKVEIGQLRKIKSSKFIIHHLPFIIYHSSFIIHSPFTIKEMNLYILDIQTHPTENQATYPLPRLDELLQLAEFSTLRRWLAEWGVEVGELQGEIDELVLKK